MNDSVKTIKELEKILKLTVKEKKAITKIIENTPMRIPKYYLNLIDKENKNDPIRKLIIPSEKELIETGEFDTSGEKKSYVQPGLQHKYTKTAVVIPTTNCAGYCRHCFRKRLAGKKSKEVAADFEKIFKYLKENKKIDNVLVTGGDPLTLPTEKIKKIIYGLRAIDSIKIIRFGTRMPALQPTRITKDKELLELIKEHSLPKKRIYFVNHFNHPKELTEKSRKAINELIEANAILVNQTVLLKDINDKPETLTELFNRLAYNGVTPYYLFQCRPVKHATHFQVPLVEGYKVFEKAKKGMSGLAKRARYVMSHDTGKIMILAVKNGKILFRYHQARNPKNQGKLIEFNYNGKEKWFEDFQPEKLVIATFKYK
ncbi:MAG: KamA family radical SAM protein [archaeon]